MLSSHLASAVITFTKPLQRFFTAHWIAAQRNKQRHQQISKGWKAQWSFLRYWKLDQQKKKKKISNRHLPNENESWGSFGDSFQTNLGIQRNHKLILWALLHQQTGVHGHLWQLNQLSLVGVSCMFSPQSTWRGDAPRALWLGNPSI